MSKENQPAKADGGDALMPCHAYLLTPNHRIVEWNGKVVGGVFLPSPDRNTGFPVAVRFLVDTSRDNSKDKPAVRMTRVHTDGRVIVDYDQMQEMVADHQVRLVQSDIAPDSRLEQMTVINSSKFDAGVNIPTSKKAA
jgi:hypothetical protein